MAATRARGKRRILQATCAAGLVLVLGGSALAWRHWTRRDPLEGTERIPAFRTDLVATLNAGGDVQSAKRTLIECELENLRIGSSMGGMNVGGSSTIIEIVPDGSMVERDAVLCRLDSSEYEELVRQQEIKVLQARAESERARLDVQSAEIGLREYREGLLEQSRRGLQEQLILNQTDIRRQKDRLAWSADMVRKGYLSEGDLIREKQTLLRSSINLRNIEGQKSNLEQFTAPITLKRLEAAVARTKEELAFQGLRLRHREMQLAKFRSQVEACTIRAPHEGMVIYANEDDGDIRVELGAIVRQKMDLFYLPNLSDMEVHATIHESVIERVAKGMEATIRVEALPKATMEGRIVSISPLPITPKGWRTSQEIKNFLAKIKVSSHPPGLRPGMSARVEILTQSRPNALVVPTTAVTVEDGREICYVAGSEGLERREVKIAPGDEQLLEVTAGLGEGEEVVTDPSRLGPEVPIVAESFLPPDPASSPAGLATTDSPSPGITQ